jgi:hypothetical protein
VVHPSGEDLVFGAVKLSEFYSEEELEELFSDAENEQDEEEQYFLDCKILLVCGLLIPSVLGMNQKATKKQPIGIQS